MTNEPNYARGVLSQNVNIHQIEREPVETLMRICDENQSFGKDANIRFAENALAVFIAGKAIKADEKLWHDFVRVAQKVPKVATKLPSTFRPTEVMKCVAYYAFLGKYGYSRARRYAKVYEFLDDTDATAEDAKEKFGGRKIKTLLTVVNKFAPRFGKARQEIEADRKRLREETKRVGGFQNMTAEEFGEADGHAPGGDQSDQRTGEREGPDSSEKPTRHKPQAKERKKTIPKRFDNDLFAEIDKDDLATILSSAPGSRFTVKICHTGKDANGWQTLEVLSVEQRL